MILYFPDLDSLRLAITSGAVPSAVSLTSATAGFDDAGHVWLQPSVALPPPPRPISASSAFRSSSENGALLAEPVHCWLQLLPLQRSACPN